MSNISLSSEQATAEQIRLAQMISDHNDADFEEKVKQVSRCTNILKLSYVDHLAFLIMIK